LTAKRTLCQRTLSTRALSQRTRNNVTRFLNFPFFFRCNTYFCYLCGAKLPAQNPYGHFSIIGNECYQQLFEGVDDLDEEFFFVDDEESDEDDLPIFNL